MTVKNCCKKLTQGISEWYAYDQRWPLPDHWQNREDMQSEASSGNFNTANEFIPAVVKKTQSQEEMYAELRKLEKYVKKE